AFLMNFLRPTPSNPDMMIDVGFVGFRLKYFFSNSSSKSLRPTNASSFFLMWGYFSRAKSLNLEFIRLYRTEIFVIGRMLYLLESQSGILESVCVTVLSTNKT